VSPRTVEASFTHIFDKLAVATRAEAIIYAASHGWISLERRSSIDVER
jgi:DNA-binding NarL/FixJ family response regulator